MLQLPHIDRRLQIDYNFSVLDYFSYTRITNRAVARGGKRTNYIIATVQFLLLNRRLNDLCHQDESDIMVPHAELSVSYTNTTISISRLRNIVYATFLFIATNVRSQSRTKQPRLQIEI